MKILPHLFLVLTISEQYLIFKLNLFHHSAGKMIQCVQTPFHFTVNINWIAYKVVCFISPYKVKQLLLSNEMLHKIKIKMVPKSHLPVKCFYEPFYTVYNLYWQLLHFSLIPFFRNEIKRERKRNGANGELVSDMIY